MVVVTRRLPEPVERALAREFELRLNPQDRPFDAVELASALSAGDAVLCTVTDRLDAQVLAANPLRCRLLANFGVGVNHIDLAAAEARGIAVSNTPEVLTDATADLTMALVLAVARRVGEGERLVRNGAWRGWAPTQMLGRMVAGRTIGIVGLGGIGRAVARRASAGFGMRVLVHTPHPPSGAETAALGVEHRASLDGMLAECDFITLHCPATAETRHLIDARRLALMPPHAVLINTARGDVVDEGALVVALRNGALGGVGLDVYEREPAVPTELTQMDNVVLLPHLGSATEETRLAMGLRVLENLRGFFRDGQLRDRVG